MQPKQKSMCLVTPYTQTKKDKCSMSFSNLTTTKILHSLTLAQNEAPCPKLNYEKKTTAHPEAILQELHPNLQDPTYVSYYYVAGKVFEETFLFFLTMETILIGMFFFERYSVNSTKTFLSNFQIT